MPTLCLAAWACTGVGGGDRSRGCRRSLCSVPMSVHINASVCGSSAGHVTEPEGTPARVGILQFCSYAASETAVMRRPHSVNSFAIKIVRTRDSDVLGLVSCRQTARNSLYNSSTASSKTVMYAFCTYESHRCTTCHQVLGYAILGVCYWVCTLSALCEQGFPLQLKRGKKQRQILVSVECPCSCLCMCVPYCEQVLHSTDANSHTSDVTREPC